MILGKMLLKYYDFIPTLKDMVLYAPWINSACNSDFSLSECRKLEKGREKEGKNSQRHEMTYLLQQTGILQSGKAL